MPQALSRGVSPALEESREARETGRGLRGVEGEVCKALGTQ